MMRKNFLQYPCPPIRHRMTGFWLIELCVLLLLSLTLLMERPHTLHLQHLVMCAVYLGIVSLVAAFVIYALAPRLDLEKWNIGKFVFCAIVGIILATIGFYVAECVFVKVYGIHLHIVMRTEYSAFRNILYLTLFDLIIGGLVCSVAYTYMYNADLKMLLSKEEAAL
ncbi:MAG: hypothetical protein LBL81_05720, partial [Tannerella sp.]|nr:hypothetical protein [Tannerella sp.]